MSPLIKILIAVAIIAGSFFIGADYGGKKEKVRNQNAIIEAGKEDVDVEARQNNIRANRDNYILLTDDGRLHKGTF